LLNTLTDVEDACWHAHAVFSLRVHISSAHVYAQRLLFNIEGKAREGERSLFNHAYSVVLHVFAFALKPSIAGALMMAEILSSTLHE